jgi:hypothetical protein
MFEVYEIGKNTKFLLTLQGKKIVRGRLCYVELMCCQLLNVRISKKLSESTDFRSLTAMIQFQVTSNHLWVTKITFHGALQCHRQALLNNLALASCYSNKICKYLLEKQFTCEESPPKLKPQIWQAFLCLSKTVCIGCLNAKQSHSGRNRTYSQKTLIMTKSAEIDYPPF